MFLSHGTIFRGKFYIYHANNKVIQYWIIFIGEGRAACGCLSGKTGESSIRVIICDYGYVKKYFCKCPSDFWIFRFLRNGTLGSYWPNTGHLAGRELGRERLYRSQVVK